MFYIPESIILFSLFNKVVVEICGWNNCSKIPRGGYGWGTDASKLATVKATSLFKSCRITRCCLPIDLLISDSVDENRFITIESAARAIKASPNPCNILPRMRISFVGASPVKTDEQVRIRNPIARVFLWPIMHESLENKLELSYFTFVKAHC